MLPINIKEEMSKIHFKIECSKLQDYYTSLLETENKKKYTISKYNPLQTVKELIQNIEYNKETIFIIIGYGFGYVLDRLLEKIGNKIHAIVIEPNKEFLEEQNKIIPVEKYTTYTNIKIIDGESWGTLKETFDRQIDFDFLYNTRIIMHYAYEEMYPIFLKELFLVIKEIRDAKILYQSTNKKLGKLFMGNIIKNVPYIAKGLDFRQHKDKYANIPALIVSAGPSLDKNIHLIKNFNGIILTGGRSLSAVLEQGVKPDYLVSIDASPISFDTLKDNKTNDIPLIAALQVNPQIVENNQAPQYFFNSPEISKELLGIDLPLLPLAGSVATLCLSTAHYMGCNPIIFIGQDMAFTGQKLHAGSCTIDNELDSVDKYRGTRLIKEYYGGQVLSRLDYIGFLRWFEEFIAYYKDAKYINATEGGAYIEGAEHISFEEAIKTYSPKDKVIIRHMNTHPNDENEIRIHIKKEVTKLKEDHKRAKQAYDLSKKLLKQYTLYKGTQIDNIIKLNNQLLKIEEYFLNDEQKESVGGYLFDHMYKELIIFDDYKEKIDETPYERDLRIATFNYEIYKNLVFSLKETIGLIEGELENHFIEVNI